MQPSAPFAAFIRNGQVFTAPSAVGTSGQQLITNADGTTSWGYAAGTINGILKANGAGVISLAGQSDIIASLAYTPINAATIGVANGVASLDSGGHVPTAQLPVAILGAMNYQGTWNATTNTPTLVSGVGTKGFFYKVSVAGATSIDGNNQWNVGDSIVFDGVVWDKIDGIANEVVSVAGKFGIVTLTSSDVSGVAALSGATFAGDVQFSGVTHAGLLLNQLTTTQRDAIGSAVNGSLIYNTTTNRVNAYLNGSWTTGYVQLAGDTMTGRLVMTTSTGINNCQLSGTGGGIAACGIQFDGTQVYFHRNSGYVAGLAATGFTIYNDNGISFSRGVPGGSQDTYLHSTGIGMWQFGNVDAAAPVAQTLGVQNVAAGTTNTAGADLTIQASKPTGTGASGKIKLSFFDNGSSGTSTPTNNYLWMFDRTNFTGPSQTNLTNGSVVIGMSGASLSFSGLSNNNLTGVTWNLGNQSQSNGADHNDFSVTSSWVPTSGASKFNGLSLAYTINQTGTANGDYAAIFLNVTETSATGANKYLMDLRTNATQRFAVTNAGAINFGIAQATLNGTTAGTISWVMPHQGTAYKKFIAYANGYENNTAVNQTITFPTAFTNPPMVTTNIAGLTVTATTTTLTIAAPNNTTLYSGVILVQGF